jgi:hypothetical protein
MTCALGRRRNTPAGNGKSVTGIANYQQHPTRSRWMRWSKFLVRRTVNVNMFTLLPDADQSGSSLTELDESDYPRIKMLG